MTTRVGAWTSPQATERSGDHVLAVPLGSLEQHGPHLPLDTDTRIAVALAEALAARVPGVAVAPALPYGSSGEHEGFGGTLSIGQDATERVLVELGRSADAWRGVVFVCGHGGNAAPVGRAVGTLVAEGRRALAWFPRVEGGDAHAGHVETSILLALSPADVDMARAAPGDVRPLAEIAGPLRDGGLRAVTANGVLGDPTAATAGDGARLLDALARDLAETVERWLG